MYNLIQIEIMKALKIKIIILTLFVSSVFTAEAQFLDCPSKLKYMRPKAPYKYSSLSKSAPCLTGKTYEFMLPLTKGKDFRISFYASPIFNNKIKFKIIDKNTGEKVMDLPGETEMSSKGECVLKGYFDDDIGRIVHPYFDFYPSSTVTLRIVIEVESIEQSSSSNSNLKVPEVRNKGCVTVYIQEKKGEKKGFN